MYSAMRSSGERSASLFFVAWILIGKFTLLSLFLAVILEAFEVAHERQLRERTVTKAHRLLGVGVRDAHEGKFLCSGFHLQCGNSRNVYPALCVRFFIALVWFQTCITL